MDPYPILILYLATLGWSVVGVSTLDDLWVSADTWGWKTFIALISGPAAWGVLLCRLCRFIRQIFTVPNVYRP